MELKNHQKQITAGSLYLPVLLRHLIIRLKQVQVSERNTFCTYFLNDNMCVGLSLKWEYFYVVQVKKANKSFTNYSYLFYLILISSVKYKLLPDNWKQKSKEHFLFLI